MLAARYDALLFDLDGVLYRGDEPVPGAPETMGALREAGAHVVFLTNNSSRTPEQVSAKLVAMGMHSAPAEVVTSATATADMLAVRGGGTAFVMGGDGVVGALRDAGLQVVDGEPEAVDLVWPGAGALVAAITTATGVEAEVVGKPHATLFHAALRRAGGLNPLVIGDRLDTDIAGATALGWDSLLVLSGVATEEEVTASPYRPTYVAPDVRALLLDDVVRVASP